MNPWGFLVIAAGILVIIIGVKGSQHDIAAAITGKSSNSTVVPGGTSGGNSAKPASGGVRQIPPVQG